MPPVTTTTTPSTTTPPTPPPVDPAAARAALTDAIASVRNPGARKILTRAWAEASDGLTAENVAVRLADLAARFVGTRQLTEEELDRLLVALVGVLTAY
nr:hypothetical protein [Propionibacterium sp.]